MYFNRAGSTALSIALAVVLGCQSTPLRSPPTSVALNSEWLKDYKLAKSLEVTDSKQSCALYKRLSTDVRFPPHLLAELRAWQVCPTGEFSPQVRREDLPPWLKEIALDVALSLAVRTADKAAEMELSTEKSKQKLPQSEKLHWLSRAMDLAKELNKEDELAAHTKRLYQIAPRLNPAPSMNQWLAVANDFRFSRKFVEARAYYEKIIASPKFRLDDKIAAFKGLRLSFKNNRQHDEHAEQSLRLITYLEKAIKLNPKSNSVRRAYYDSQVYYARALWTLGRSGEASAVFDNIEKRMKGRISLAELYWLKGRMAEEKGDLNLVSEMMDKALKEHLTEPDLRDKILWYSAWNERRQKNFARASEIFARIDESTQGEFTRLRALYWHGKTLEEMNQPELAKQTLEKLISLDPLGYYGLLAHRHLGLAISLKRVDSPALNADFKAEDLPLDDTLADWLAQVNESEALIALLDGAAQAYRKQKEQSNEGWITLYRHYARGGLYNKLYANLSSLTPERRKSIVEMQPELLFPQPWNDDVKLAALQTGIDEELIYAIMRQESAFDPRARSLADAFGLMQILPEVAEATAKASKIPYSSMDDLYSPKTNISIGAAHVKDLLKRHKGQFILAVASYNASERAIMNWVKMRYRGDSLEFIEEIPYEETRVYVRLVMRNLIFYSLLKSKSASIEFPAWVLKLDGPAS